MEVHLRPETESRIKELAAKTGRTPDELVEDAMAAYLRELAQVGENLDSRYDEVKNGRVTPLDGETFFQDLRQREEELLKRRSSQ